MRHVPRTHRVDLDWLFERVREDPGISIRYVNTKMQIADILTKGSFTAAQWEVLCRLAQIGPPGIPVKNVSGSQNVCSGTQNLYLLSSFIGDIYGQQLNSSSKELKQRLPGTPDVTSSATQVPTYVHFGSSYNELNKEYLNRDKSKGGAPASSAGGNSQAPGLSQNDSSGKQQVDEQVPAEKLAMDGLCEP